MSANVAIVYPVRKIRSSLQAIVRRAKHLLLFAISNKSSSIPRQAINDDTVAINNHGWPICTRQNNGCLCLPSMNNTIRCVKLLLQIAILRITQWNIGNVTPLEPLNNIWVVYVIANICRNFRSIMRSNYA